MESATECFKHLCARHAAGDQSGRRPAPVEAVIVSDSPPSHMGISLALA
jgi:hypothetical protein